MRLLREEEYERARSGVGAWDVEVEDGADIRGDLAVVGGAFSLVWAALRDGDDQVRVLVVAAQIRWAGLARS